MNEAPKPKAPKLEPIGVVAARALREEARAFRLHASNLLAAELVADWAKVAAVRADLVGVAMQLERAAEGHDV